MEVICGMKADCLGNSAVVDVLLGTCVSISHIHNTKDLTGIITFKTHCSNILQVQFGYLSSLFVVEESDRGSMSPYPDQVYITIS